MTGLLRIRKRIVVAAPQMKVKLSELKNWQTMSKARRKVKDNKFKRMETKHFKLLRQKKKRVKLCSPRFQMSSNRNPAHGQLKTLMRLFLFFNNCNFLSKKTCPNSFSSTCSRGYNWKSLLNDKLFLKPTIQARSVTLSLKGHFKFYLSKIPN